MHLRRTAAAAVGLLAMLPVLAACGDDGAELAAGDIVPAREDDQFAEGSASFVVLPTGRLEVQVGEPVTALRSSETRQLSAVEAPKGSTFVPITWQYDAGTFGDWADYLGDTPSPVIDMVSDGAEYRVPAPPEEGRGSKSFYVLVSGSAKELGLRVGFDGVAQTIDLRTGERDEGDAAALYDLEKPRRKWRPCDAAVDFHNKTGVAEHRCLIGRVSRLPYAAGAWAEPGRTWLAFELLGSVKRYSEGTLPTGPIGSYLPASVSTELSVGGQEPAGVYPHPGTLCPNIQEGGCADAHYVVVDAAAKGKAGPKLVMDQRYQLLLVSEWGAFKGKKQTNLRATSTIRVP